jgi:secreted Zn-dependent insulinase-like peptidase
MWSLFISLPLLDQRLSERKILAILACYLDHRSRERWLLMRIGKKTCASARANSHAWSASLLSFGVLNEVTLNSGLK